MKDSRHYYFTLLQNELAQLTEQEGVYIVPDVLETTMCHMYFLFKN